jgi:hypothetical protein
MVDVVPRIATIDGVRIYLYPDDHMPPHFHILCADGSEAQVKLVDLRVLRSNIKSSDLNRALNWAEVTENRERLLLMWRELNERE